MEKMKGKVMQAVRFFLTLIVISLAGSTGSAYAQVDVGVSLGEEGLRGFYLGVGEYFRVPEREVIIIKEKHVIREKHIHVEEMPVVYLIAQKARVKPEYVIDLRRRGKSWMDITIHYGLSPEIYYVYLPSTVRVGPPYGKAYGHYKKKPKKEWNAIVLDDDDVINLVNLKFVSEHYGHPAVEVVMLRSKGKDFVVIHQEVRTVKGGKGAEFAEHRNDDHPGKGRGQEKGKGHQKDKD
jgi:hypothetical protein